MYSTFVPELCKFADTSLCTYTEELRKSSGILQSGVLRLLYVDLYSPFLKYPLWGDRSSSNLYGGSDHVTCLTVACGFLSVYRINSITEDLRVKWNLMNLISTFLRSKLGENKKAKWNHAWKWKKNKTIARTEGTVRMEILSWDSSILGKLNKALMVVNRHTRFKEEAQRSSDSKYFWWSQHWKSLQRRCYIYEKLRRNCEVSKYDAKQCADLHILELHILLDLHIPFLIGLTFLPVWRRKMRWSSSVGGDICQGDLGQGACVLQIVH
jgi:hypothetical protein